MDRYVEISNFTEKKDVSRKRIAPQISQEKIWNEKNSKNKNLGCGWMRTWDVWLGVLVEVGERM
jgi:hypothetical protein